MPISLSRIWLITTLVLAGIHLVVFFSILILREPLGLEELNDTVVFGSIYIPLVPWKLVEVPVFQASSAMFPPPNVFGWGIAIMSWVLLYALIGWLFQKTISRLQ